MHDIDRIYFAAHDETHRIRRATGEEAARFKVRRLDHPKLLTVVRHRDGAAATYAFREGDDIDRAGDFELAGWFDDDLDKEAARGSH